MTTPHVHSRSPGRLLTALCALGLALGVAAPAHAVTQDGRNPARPSLSSPSSATPDIVESTRRGGRSVALTFDDGPDPRNTPRLLAVLREHRARAVFCLWGDHVRQHPGLVRRIAAEGHTLCNHTMHHDDMGDWSPEEVRADLLETNAAIREAVPHARIPYFRAPYGSWGQTPGVAADLGMQPLGWSLVVEDWAPPGTDELVRRLEEGVAPRSVVLLHDGGGDRGQTVEAVARVVPALKADGWHFTLPARRGR
ncbi:MULTISPECIES: polysaccharide deacetylase family protein [unclassified Nocardiopsis]|uniref:polysaccharide deacetylase family protein n=1 Tax=unclassified Nocardiopsis TaxID=2649073 RepID=UPI00135B884F|nr:MULTISPECIES: polysaccharide deacetylase family protein [unclassified Nocardiopsis]